MKRRGSLVCGGLIAAGLLLAGSAFAQEKSVAVEILDILKANGQISFCFSCGRHVRPPAPFSQFCPHGRAHFKTNCRDHSFSSVEYEAGLHKKCSHPPLNIRFVGLQYMVYYKKQTTTYGR